MQKIISAGKKLEKIESNDISIAVDSLGAKVLAINFGNRNILYYNETDIKHSGIPICMPFFGSLDDNTLKIEKNQYKIGPHGFFRDCEFELYNTSTKILAILKSDHSTMKIYPYQFTFKVNFELVEKGMKMDLIFINNDSRELWTAPGLHPYFRVKNKDKVYLQTKAATGNDSFRELAETPLEKTGVFDIIDEKNGMKRLQVKNAPNIQLIRHGLKETLLEPGDDSRISISADMEIFNRMTIWRPTSEAEFICVEPSFEVNAINTQKGILLKSGDELKTTFMVKRL
jgi:galactose mutarotase-like enzyme